MWQSAVVNARKRPPGRGQLTGRRRRRRTGQIVLVLLVGSVALALYLAVSYHLGVAQTLVAVLVGGGAPAGVYLAWATYRDAQSDSAAGENSSAKSPVEHGRVQQHVFYRGIDDNIHRTHSPVSDLLP